MSTNDPTAADTETQSRRTTLRQLAGVGALMTAGTTVTSQNAEAHGVRTLDVDDAPDWGFRPAGMPHKSVAGYDYKLGWRIAGKAPNRRSRFRMAIVKNGNTIKSQTFTVRGEFTVTMWTYRNADTIRITRA